jgi:predicted nucleic acid-binding protein
VVLIDSDILIWHLRGRSAASERLLALQEDEILACSVITVYEVLRGATPHQRPDTEALLKSLVRLEVSEAVARDAADAYQLLRHQNITVSMPDMLIGCTARVRGIALLTGNRAHFPLPGLVILDG